MAKLNSGTRIYGNVTVDTFVTATGNITGGNILTAGVISATGNITGSYILGNGSQLTGLPATYGNSNVNTLLAAWGSNTVSTTGTITAGNVTGGNLLTNGQVSTGGNIYVGTGNAGFIYGNATFMTGISAAISVSKIENGNSNVWVQTAGGDVTVTAGGVSNVGLFSTGSLTVKGAIGNPKTFAANTIVGAGLNATIIGPVDFGSYNLTIPSGSTVYVYSPGG